MFEVLTCALPAFAQVRRTVGVIFSGNKDSGQPGKQLAQVFTIKIPSRPAFAASPLWWLIWPGKLTPIPTMLAIRPVRFDNAFPVLLA
jgi:hypothetical protein